MAGINKNLRLAHTASQTLGDIPPVLAAPGFLEHGPDERAVIIFVAFLCARVLEVSKEDRAAQVIQHFYRHKKSWQPGDAPCIGHGLTHHQQGIDMLMMLQHLSCLVCCAGQCIHVGLQQWLHCLCFF